MIGLSCCANYSNGQKRWSDILDLKFYPFPKRVTNPIDIVTDFRDEFSKEQERGPVRRIIAGQRHHVAVRPPISLDTD